MLRRRKPFLYQEDTGATLPSPKKINVTTATTPSPNYFETLPHETIKYLFRFFSNHEMPIAINKKITANTQDILKTKADDYFKQYIQHDFVTDLNHIDDVIICLKTLGDYNHLCMMPEDSVLEKQAKLAVSLHMMMQLMLYLTTNEIVKFMLPLGIFKPMLFDADSSIEYIEMQKKIDANDVSTFKTQLLKRFETSLKSSNKVENDATTLAIDSNFDFLVEQMSLLKRSVQSDNTSWVSSLVCGFLANPLENKLIKLFNHCFDLISNNIKTLCLPERPSEEALMSFRKRT